uniref:Uncharacterized protein n=1 Tax=Arundo donax TaxID=35708 RepID=A0A0A8Y821_ARUDO
MAPMRRQRSRIHKFANVDLVVTPLLILPRILSTG